MSVAFVLAVGMALAFALTNGFHDAANAIATLVATRVARPLPAVVMASAFNLLGPLLLGAAVADTVATIVLPPIDDVVPVVGAGLSGAVAWNPVSRRMAHAAKRLTVPNPPPWRGNTTIARSARPSRTSSRTAFIPEAVSPRSPSANTYESA